MDKKANKPKNVDPGAFVGLPLAEKLDGFETKDLSEMNPPKEMINGARQKKSK